MTYETTISGENFLPFIKSATDFVGDAKVVFDDYVLISSLDAAGVLLVDTSVRNPNPPPDPIEVILDLRSIVGLTSVKKDVTFILDGSSRVRMKTGRMEYILPTIIEPHLKSRKIPEKVFPVQLDINALAFAEGIKGMIDASKSIEEMLGFWLIVESPEVFYFQDKLKQYSKAIFSPDEEYEVQKFEQSAASMFSVDYLEDIAKHVKAFDRVILNLSNNDPMILVCAGDERRLAYAIANRLPDN